MLWIKALHIVSVISWMAGLLYLPRLFVYHCDTEINSTQSETFKIMERRLYRGIMLPAMVASWAFGGALIHMAGAWGQGWFFAKLGLVVVLSGFHMLLGTQRRAFAEDRNRHSARYFRFLNEVPTLLMIGIVILVVVKPF